MLLISQERNRERTGEKQSFCLFFTILTNTAISFNILLWLKMSLLSFGGSLGKTWNRTKKN